MKTILLFLFIGMYTNLLSQSDRVYETNAWGSVVWNHSFTNRWGSTFDAGYRSCDHFFNERRQILARGLLAYKIGKEWRLGAGFAQFQHRNPINRSISNESRPFLHVNFSRSWSNWSINVRLREEMRLYPVVDKQFFRTRLQGQIGWKSRKAWLNPRFGFEGFVTPMADPLIETRTTLSNTINASKRGAITLFYTLQTQSTIDGNQHIIGLQFTINTGTDE